MATSHEFSVVKNQCYKAPRHPKTNKPATENERPQSSLQSDGNLEDYGENCGRKERSSSRRSKRDKEYLKRSLRAERNALAQSLIDMSVDDEDFYKNLLSLKNEHKKSLKTIERMYYTQLEKEHLGFDFDDNTRISVDYVSDKRHEIATPDCYDPLEKDWIESTDARGNVEEAGSRVSFSPPEDHVKDMSNKNYKLTENKENEEVDGSESEELEWEHDENENSDNEELNSQNTKPWEMKGSYKYKEMFPGRSSAIDTVEDMWSDFNVYDYAPDRSSPPRESNKKETWTPQITIPKPFSMTIREANKSAKEKTRSQRILEQELKLKRHSEEAELQKKFRAQPIPATTFLPLYDEIIDNNEARRREVRELSKAILKSTEKPFSFVMREDAKKEIRRSKSLNNLIELKQKEKKRKEKKQFKANPFPNHLFDLTLADKIAEQEEYRAIKVRMRAQEMLASSSLPPNMSARGREYTIGKLRRKLLKEKEKKAFMTKEHKFRPQINPDVPDFDELHWQFEKELRTKKKEIQPTVMEPFNLRTAHTSGARKTRCSRSMECSVEGTGPRSRSASRERPASAWSTPDILPHGKTESARLRETFLRKSLEERRIKECQETTKNQRRRQREKELRPKIAKKVMANDPSWQKKKIAQDKLKSFRESDRVRREEYKRELVEMEARVDNRPLLFEREAQVSAKRAAERKYADILRSAGVDEALVTSLVTKDGKIIDVESDEELAETGSDYDYSQSYTEDKKYRLEDSFDRTDGSGEYSDGSEIDRDEA